MNVFHKDGTTVIIADDDEMSTIIAAMQSHIVRTEGRNAEQHRKSLEVEKVLWAEFMESKLYPPA